jgi:membrane-bound ClpP family serine protease
LGAGVFLFVVGLVTDTEVIVTLTGLVPFVLGSLLLFAPFTPASPAAPSVRVSPWLIAGMSGLILLVTFGVLRAAIRATRLPPQSGAQRLVGMTGIAMTDLAPNGDVRVDLEQWSATAMGEPVRAGEQIVVIGVVGVRLQVQRAKDAANTGGQ